MNVKRYIHPRNKYKKPPDYKKLAIMYPGFRKVAITELTGKVRIDFHKKESLRVLTETLLKHDFDLHVSIPPDNLNPALTLRMNYILWIEDLMNHSKLEMDKVTGIDIGTGAICIYALLLAKIYRCRVIGTEVDRKSAEYAKKCIRRNNLENLLKVITVNSDSIFKEAMKDGEVYDFSMCNPPFFETKDDGVKVAKVLPPRNASTGSENELKTEGGEVAFVTKMIEESVQLRDRIKIYSTMIGRKADLFHLKKLIKMKIIENSTWTEFCQGHTTRWGLAWSFLPKNIVDLTTAPVIRKNGGKSIVPSLEKDYKTLITFPTRDKLFCMDDLITFLKTTTEELNIKLQEVSLPEDSFDGWVCRLIAKERTWEHARRKRRLAQRQLTLKRLETVNSECIEGNANVEGTSHMISITEENTSNKTLQAREGGNGESSNKEAPNMNIPLLACKLWVEIEEAVVSDGVFKIWMVFENGSGGLDALQSLRQCLINKLGIREMSLHNPTKPVKKRKRTKKNSSEGISESIKESQSDDKRDSSGS